MDRQQFYLSDNDDAADDDDDNVNNDDDDDDNEYDGDSGDYSNFVANLNSFSLLFSYSL